MMKRLSLLRHAKSSTKEDVEDHERPLNRRGRDAARRIGKHLPELTGPLDLILCSSAVRTRETLDLVLPELSRRPRIAIEDELYLADKDRLIDRLRRLDEEAGSVLLIGHNPGLHDLAIALADKESPDFPRLVAGKFPTAACVSFSVPSRWSVIAHSRNELVGYMTPKSLAREED